MATLLELAQLSATSYGDPVDPPLNGNWTLLESYTGIDDGYFGQAFQNIITKEIVITNRGTRLTSLDDYLAGIKLATGVITPEQVDARNFALKIVSNPLYSGLPIIETGHSKGGNEAQAATVALAEIGATVSAVTFNSPGIGGYPVGIATYNVLNLYDQGDVIHLAGGTHLGRSAEVPAGPDPAKLAFGIPLLAAGPVGAVTFLGKVIWDILGTAHSIDTMVSYLASDPLGQENWPGTSSIALPGDQSNHWATVNLDGSVTLADAAGDTFQYSTDAQVFTWSKPDGSSGSSTLNFDGSSTETTIRADGISSTHSVDVDGNTLTQNYDASETLVRSYRDNVDGSVGVTTTSSSDYSSIVKNADGGFSYMSYSLVNNASHNPVVDGFTSTINANGSGSGTSHYMDGSLAGAWTINANGSGSFTGNNKDGSLADECAINADKSVTYMVHEANGFIYTGSLNADGSGSGTIYFSDGRMTTWSRDASNGITYTQYAPDGTLVGTSNQSNAISYRTDGTSFISLYGGVGVSYSQDGSISGIQFPNSGISYYPDGSISGIWARNPDVSITEAFFNADGSVEASNFVNADGVGIYSSSDGRFQIGGGSYGGMNYYYSPDGSSYSYSMNADKSYTYTSYGTTGLMGSKYTQNPDFTLNSSYNYYPDGSTFSEYSSSADGSHSTIYHNADGTISSSDVVTINADGSSTHTWSYSDGNHSTSTTYPDGSSSGLNYKADGSYISFINDGLGSVTTNFFGASGNALGLSVSINDAQGNPVSTIYDVNGIVLGVATGSMAQQLLPAGASAIQFVSSISSADLAVSQDSQGNFLISSNNGTGTLDIPAQSAVTSSVEASFANGTSWQFVNAAGNSYDFTAGSGVTYLINPSSVQFGAGITSSMITLGLGSLMLRVGNSGDLLHIEGINPADALNSGVLQSFTFADGTTLSYSDLLARGFDIYGTTGNEMLTGTNLNDRIYGDDGNDTLQGGVGNDTYLFNLGGGQDTINDGDSTVGNLDTIRFGAGVAASDITFSRSGNDLVLGINGTTDQVKIQNWGYGNDYRIEQVLFADGTAWDAAYLQTQAAAIIGTTGDDYLYGDSGSNTFDGGAGNDYLNGGYGNDTYLFNLGDGQDAISEWDNAAGNVDTIRFGVGIAANDITFTRSGMDLVLGINGTTDQVTIRNWGYWNAKIERVEFADGAVLDAAYLQEHTQASSVLGTSGDDVLTLWSGESGLLQGLEGNDDLSVIDGNNTLDGGAGNDYLAGGFGNDVYIFEPGGGQDVIEDWSDTVGSVDTIRFCAGILPDEINFSFNGGDLVLGINGTTDQLTIWGWTDINSRIERVEFADGTVWDAAYLQAQISALPIVGTTGNDYLNGDAGNNTFDGGAGNDTLYGDAGNDTYLFNLGGGQDTIDEYDDITSNVDTIRFGAGIAASDIIFSRSGNDLVLGINGTADQVTIQNWGSGDAYHIERVEFADGAAWDAAQLQAIVSAAPIVGTEDADYLQSGAGENATLQGLGGDDSLYGNDGNDTLEGGAGNDYLSGGIGNDTYLFNLGGGQDTIYEYDYTASNVDTIRFGAGIAESDITFTRSGMDWVLGIDGTPDQLKIQNWGYGEYYRIERVEFADGTVWDVAQIQSNIAAVSDFSGTDGGDSLLVWAGESATLHGLGGDDYLQGMEGNDTLDGGTGNDYLSGSAGNDTYLFNLGGAQDIISDGDNATGNVDTIRFGAGIAASDITFTRSGADLVLGINGTTDQLKILNWGYGDAYRIERVEFADGTVWDAAYLQTQASALLGLPLVGTEDNDFLVGWPGENATFQGMGGDDALLGNDGNDTLDGGIGNDSLYGGAGNDTYLFNLGDGQDTVSDSDSAVANLDTIRFGARIAANDITFTRSGMDLVLGINGTSDQLTICDWGYGNDYRIERLEFADGTAWDTAYLQTLIPAPTLVGTNADDVLSLWAGDVGTLQGLDGNDELTVIDGNNTLDGGVGNDYLMGGLGDDVYVFNPGDGQDEIDDGSDIAGSVDTVRFGAGILPDNITFTFNGEDLVLGINGTTDQLTILNWAYDTYSRIERVEFADGTVWDAAYLQDRAVMPIMGTSSDDQLDASNYLGANGYLLNQNVSIQGLEGNDSLYGGDGNDRLDGGAGDDSLAGGAGNDTLIGGEGNDTYAFNLGDGTDAISDAAISLAGAEVNTLVLGAGITAAMITPVISAAGEVTLDFGNGDSIRINQVGNLSIQNIQLADGNVIAIESLLNAPPVAVADSVIVSEDTAQATIVAADLLANDTDPDTGDVLSIAGFDSITALGNLVSMDAAGNLVFDPSTSSGQGIGNRYQYLAQGQIATDTFNYSITDTAGATSTAQVNMTIAGLNDAPVAAADAAYVREDLNITATGNVLGNDTDIDQGTVLSVADAGIRAGSYGSLNLAADGSYSYAVDNASPTVQSLGRTAQVAEHFGYTATDGMVGASAVLDAFLNGANDAPILVAPLADQDFTRDKHFSWQMPEGSFTDIDQGDTLGYAATLADGSVLPDWLNFDASTRTFSGETPKEVGFVDVQVTATDSVAATGSTAGSLSASDVFRISVSHGNEGVGNGKDAPPPGHDRNTNDGGGTAPGRPGSPFDTSGGGNGHPTASAKHPQEQEPHDRSSDAKKHKDDTPQQDTGDSGSQRTDELIRTWFEEESTSERYSSFSTLDRHGAWGGQVDRQVKRNVGRGVSEDVSSEWERMNVQLKKHLEQSGGDDGHFSESGTGSRSFGLFGSGGQQGIPQLGTGNGQQLKALAGLKEGLERLGC